MHLHGYHFRVVTMNGKPPHPGDAGWKDTVAVYPNQTVVVRPYFDYFPGALRLPLPCRRARRHVDDGPDGGGRVIAALVLTAALAAPATHTVQAVSTATDNVWSPAALNAQPGDTIQWNLDTPDRPTAHDVWLTAPGAAERQLGKGTMLGGTGTASEVLNDVGSYEFVCKIHAARA